MQERLSSKILAESFDNLAKDYDSSTKTFHHQISHYVVENNLLTHLSGQEHLKILDSGGGTGRFSILLKQKGFDVTLTDISTKSIEIAKAKFENMGLTIPSHVCDSEKTNFQNNTFDFVMFNGAVMTYTPSPEKLIKEAKRILKPNGQIWFDFFNTVGWAIELNDLASKSDIALENNTFIQMPDWDYPARLMSIKEVEDMLTCEGFRTVKKYGLMCLSHSLPIETRYSNNVSQDTVTTSAKISYIATK